MTSTTATSAARRARALRAARVASASVSILGLAACSGGSTGGSDAFSSPDAFTMAAPDAFTPEPDAAESIDAHVIYEIGPPPDAGSAEPDAHVVVGDDAFVVTGDAGCSEFPPTDQVCCELARGTWDGESNFCLIAVPGPFVPPAMA